MDKITKKDVFVGACLVFLFYKLNQIHFNVSGRTILEDFEKKDCGCGGH